MRHRWFAGLTVALALGTLTTPVRAQERENPQMSAEQRAELSPVFDTFFLRLQRGEAEQVYADWLDDTPMPNLKAAIPGMVEQTQMLLSLYGGIRSWEAVDSECLVPSVCRVRYVVHTQRIPVFFSFDVYRAPSGWKMTRIGFTDQLQNIF